MDNKTLKELFRNISVWRRGDERAPNKPLLILLALGKCISGSERLVNYEDIEEKLKSLLIEFGPPRSNVHPEYPFWRLQNDGIWEVAADSDNLRRRVSNTDVPTSELKRNHARGGFKQDIYNALREDKKLIYELARMYLDEAFPETLHDDILAAVGLDIFEQCIKRKRDPRFRDRVLMAYEYSCAICGLNLRYSNNSSLCIEAAHIKWHQAGGPDEEKNGLALCVLHHKLFDRGAYTLSSDNMILVSQHIHGDVGLDDWLLRYHRKLVRSPISTKYFPDPQLSAWHQKEVFRSPTRD